MDLDLKPLDSLEIHQTPSSFQSDLFHRLMGHERFESRPNNVVLIAITKCLGSAIRNAEVQQNI